MGTIGYYGFLATRIPPARLLGAAARRAARAARNRVAPPLAPSRDRLLSVLGCDGAATLARLLARPRPCRAPWTPASLRGALDRHLPGEAERAMARAEDAACGRIAVFGRGLAGGTPRSARDRLAARPGERRPVRFVGAVARASARAGARPPARVGGRPGRAVGGTRAGRGARRAPPPRPRRGPRGLGLRLRRREPRRVRRPVDELDGGGAPRVEPRPRAVAPLRRRRAARARPRARRGTPPRRDRPVRPREPRRRHAPSRTRDSRRTGSGSSPAPRGSRSGPSRRGGGALAPGGPARRRSASRCTTKG